MKIAIVTGASSGLGREFARQIDKKLRGIEEIWLIARREKRMMELEKELATPVRILPLDLADNDSLKVLETLLEKEKPNVKLLVNAAGYGKMGQFANVNRDQQLGMIDLDCRGLCGVTHVVLPYISNNSRIIQFASAAGFVPQPEFAVYAAAKAFVISFTKALHSELRRRKIYVTAVCPGPVNTEFFEVAETTGHIPLYKKLVMADPAKVVAKAMKDSAMGRTESVYGVMMQSFEALCKIIPHRFILIIMETVTKNKRIDW